MVLSCRAGCCLTARSIPTRSEGLVWPRSGGGRLPASEKTALNCGSYCQNRPLDEFGSDSHNEGMYEVSDRLRVRSLKRVVRRGRVNHRVRKRYPKRVQ